ncbi:MAG TPA: OsmC family peroxiredoxin [Fimbriimonadaceae bacterium]|mgnify:CR=1 FL=1|nr:OsmC family peroxiredoxin [Fimbriimonadaceae bacterium]HRJ97616.1 OsmC family peroxiredoxin [Fimbriimonadaceae bacterium]
MKATAKAAWTGDLKTGSGSFSAMSGVFTNTPYDFRKRFEGEPGTNPEELIAAAHAACFSMALSGQLGQRDIVAHSIETVCEVTMENGTLTRSLLRANVSAPGADEGAIREAGEVAKAGCPISKALNLEIALDLTIAT